MSIRYLVMFAACMVISGNTLAEDGETLAEKNNCVPHHFRPLDGTCIQRRCRKIQGQQKCASHAGKESAQRRCRRMGQNADAGHGQFGKR